jgi:hypothetical protein
MPSKAISEWIRNTLPVLTSNLASRVDHKIEGANITIYRAGSLIRIDIKLTGEPGNQ